MVMTIVKGLILYGTVGAINYCHHGGSHTIIGLMFILLECICSAYSSILQTITTDEYHYLTLSLVSFTDFLFGSVEGVLVAWVVEGQFYYTIWTVFRWDVTLVFAIYAGIFAQA
ncbi:hypothetical protein P8452_74057 [Trifolium repens]|nr:hypothetical protein P8452_74057 [Trifolium repens]